MGEEINTADTNTKTQLSLAAALFFSPLVHNMLKNGTRDISEKDKDFIRGYIKFGYITLLFGVIAIATGIGHYLLPIQLLSVAYTTSIFILIALLVISVVSILSDIRLLKGGDHPADTYTLEGNKKDIILTYLPINNISLWYKMHNFDKPNWRIKESIVLRTLIMFVSMTGSILTTAIVIILLILRIAALMSDIDFLNTHIKKIMNTLFLKNPEEIRGFATGLIIYIVKSLVSIFKTLPQSSIDMEVQKEKEIYSRIIDFKENKIILSEYILGIVLMVGSVYLIQVDFTIRTYYLGFGLLLARYLIMAIQLKHLPHLPIAREIILLFTSIGNIFKRQTHQTFIQKQ